MLKFRRMKKYDPILVVAFGMFLIVCGVAYGAFFAGLPGPDDSPSEVARVVKHGNIAIGTECVGALCFLVGAVVGTLRLFPRKLVSLR